MGDARETRHVRRAAAGAAARIAAWDEDVVSRGVFSAWRTSTSARAFDRRARIASTWRGWRVVRERTRAAIDSCATRRATRILVHTWRAWTAAAKPGIDASRARARAAWLEETQALGRRALTEWSVAARASGEARRRAERKDAPFVKVGAWLEELRANKALSPSPEANRRSPAGRAARRAQFKKRD